MTIYIQDPAIKNQYRSTGIVRGIYLPSDTASAEGVLVTRDGMFPAELFRRWWQPPNEELVWNCWLKTFKEDPCLHFILKGTYRNEEGANISPDSILEDRFSIRGNLLFWNEDQGNFGISIRPNKEAIRKFNPFFVEIKGRLVSPKPGAFWEIEAVRKGRELLLVEAQEVFPPIKKKKGKPNAKGKDKSQSPAKTSQPKKANQSQNTNSEKMMTKNEAKEMSQKPKK